MAFNSLGFSDWSSGKQDKFVRMCPGAPFASNCIEPILQSNTEIADGAITTPKLANGAVTTAKLADDAVTTVTLADGAVTTAKLADDAVTNAVVAADANIADTKLATISTAGKVSGAAISGQIESLSYTTQLYETGGNVTLTDAYSGSLITCLESGGERTITLPNGTQGTTFRFAWRESSSEDGTFAVQVPEGSVVTFDLKKADDMTALLHPWSDNYRGIRWTSEGNDRNQLYLTWECFQTNHWLCTGLVTGTETFLPEPEPELEV